ncbi:MAG TPA: UbiA family prenyltransferase [Terriglobales bacterium]|nr:UbiA family prenyltransferase [Terriglobales bacterium]
MATSTSPGASRTREGRLALYLRLARPFTLLPPMVGIVAGSLVAYGATHASWSWRVVLGAAAAAALLNAASNVLNQICDRAIDRRNKPWRPIPAGTVTTAEAARLSAALYAAALLVPALVGWQLFALYAAAAAATYLYSAPPLRTKRSPWGANLTIAAARGELLKVAGWAAVSSVTLSWEPWIIGAVFFLFLLGATTTKDFADMAGDAAEGCRTLPVVLGPRRAAWAIAPFFFLPWILLIAAASAGWLSASRSGIDLLAALMLIWGGWVARLLIRDPAKLVSEGENHPAWRQMYWMMMTAHLALAAVYLAPR